MSHLLKYFPELNDDTLDKLRHYTDLLTDWNQKINLISRKETDVELHHIVHSLAIYKLIKFQPGTRVLDLGTGGGLPGIPLAIVFPEVHFTLVDSIRKKTIAVDDMIKELKLSNAEVRWSRVEDLKGPYDFVVTRAVAKVNKLKAWTRHLISKADKNALPNGLIALKGGDMQEELSSLKKRHYHDVPLSQYFSDPYFEGKLVIYFQ